MVTFPVKHILSIYYLVLIIEIKLHIAYLGTKMNLDMMKFICNFPIMVCVFRCDFMNFAKNTVCLQCDAKRPQRQLLPGEWECPQYVLLSVLFLFSLSFSVQFPHLLFFCSFLIAYPF